MIGFKFAAKIHHFSSVVDFYLFSSFIKNFSLIFRTFATKSTQTVIYDDKEDYDY